MADPFRMIEHPLVGPPAPRTIILERRAYHVFTAQGLVARHAESTIRAFRLTYLFEQVATSDLGAGRVQVVRRPLVTPTPGCVLAEARGHDEAPPVLTPERD